MSEQTNGQTNIDKYVAAFVKCRDELRHLKEKYEADCAPYKNLQNDLAGKLTKFMDDHKVKNLMTAHGTCYTTTRWSAPLQDPDAFMKFVIATQAWDMLDRRANATAVKEFIAKNNAPVPGCSLSAFQQIGVRRKGDAE